MSPDFSSECLWRRAIDSVLAYEFKRFRTLCFQTFTYPGMFKLNIIEGIEKIFTERMGIGQGPKVRQWRLPLLGRFWQEQETKRHACKLGVLKDLSVSQFPCGDFVDGFLGNTYRKFMQSLSGLRSSPAEHGGGEFNSFHDTEIYHNDNSEGLTDSNFVA